MPEASLDGTLGAIVPADAAGIQRPSKEGKKRASLKDESLSSSKSLHSGLLEPAPSARDKLVAFLDTKLSQSVMMSATLLALYGDDIRLFGFHKATDEIFFLIFTACLLLFLLELTLQSLVIEDFKWSFFFWLDCVAVASLIPDIAWFNDPISALYSGPAGSDSGGGGAAAELQNAGRAARAGTRAGRIVRLVKLIQLVNVNDLIRPCLSKERKEELDRLAEEAKANAKEKRVQASRLGKILSEQTTRRVIMGVLSMMVVIPLLEQRIEDLSPIYGLEQLFLFGRSSCSNLDGLTQVATAGSSCTDAAEPWMSSEGWEHLAYHFATVSMLQDDEFPEIHSPLLWLRAPDRRLNGTIADIVSVKTKRCQPLDDMNPPYSFPDGGIAANPCPEGYCCWHALESCASTGSGPDCPWRDAELVTHTYVPPFCRESASEIPPACSSLKVQAKFLHRKEVEIGAGMSMIQTTFIVFILGVGSVSFSKDTQTLVIAPIEKMVNIVKQLADDPLKKPDIIDDEEEDLTREKAKNSGQLETSMLETTILKIGGLLQVGFGEAGALIIGDNMADQGDGDVINIMIPGRKVYAAFGFAKIRDFNETTECLLEEVMVFVNKIARIVHICVHEWQGAANKNIGDSFLVTWLLRDLEIRDGETVHPTPRTSEMCDRSLMAFIKVIAEVRRATDLNAYAKHPKIIPKFGMAYRVTLGFGLHFGWGIEGAIGSDHKIDASYLSPHVNTASRLESISKTYDVNIIVSEKFFNLLSQKGKERCRKIDVVILKGTTVGVGLYCVDINLEVPLAPEGHQLSHLIQPPEMSHAELQSRGTDAFFFLDQDVDTLQQGVTSVFRSYWESALSNYIAGNWRVAAESFAKIEAGFSECFQGPTRCLLAYIESLDLEPPEDWNGCRELKFK